MSGDIIKAGAFSVLFLACFMHFPVTRLIAPLFVPLPILYYRLRQGRQAAFLILGITLLAAFGMQPTVSFGLLFFIKLMLIGFFLAESYEKKTSVDAAVGGTALAALCAMLVFVVLYGNLSGRDIYAEVSRYVSGFIDYLIELLRAMEGGEKRVLPIEEHRDILHYYLLRMIPAQIVASTLFETWLCMLISKSMLIQLGYPFPDYGKLNLWKAPDHLVWGVIGCGFALFLPSSSIRVIAISGLIILMTLYFFQGIAIIWFYFETKEFSPVLKVVFVSFILFTLQQIALIFVIGLGFFDVWLNFRQKASMDGESE